MNTSSSLKQFYASDAATTYETKLAAASSRVSSGSGAPASSAEDAINWKEHVRRYHNGSFDPRTEKCEVYERMRKAEEEREMLIHTDADGDGKADDYSSFGKSDDEGDGENESESEVGWRTGNGEA